MQRDARGGAHEGDSAQGDGTQGNQLQQRRFHHNTCDLFEPKKLFNPDPQSGGLRPRPMASDCGDFAEAFNAGRPALRALAATGDTPVTAGNEANFKDFPETEGKSRGCECASDIPQRNGRPWGRPCRLW
jgi:hypothetical protein